MGKVLEFPGRRISNKYRNLVPSMSQESEKDPLEARIIASGEEGAFLSLIKEWPCFRNHDPDIDLSQLFEQYFDDELTLSQDCALEFMFHMHDPESTFDIGNALYTWDEEDRNFFMLNINMHAEIIDKVKQEEL